MIERIMSTNFKKYLIAVTKSDDCVKKEVIQSLWSGYGEIARYELTGASNKTIVVKHIAINESTTHPRGWDTANSHNRKVKSYQVETYWYEKWSRFCTGNCRIPGFIGSFSEGDEAWIILEDLDSNFPARLQEATFSETKVCLKWLANFHATFLNKKPEGLWKVGTYWHLDTRPDEFVKIEHKELKQKAHLIDLLLNKCTYQTIVHGDAKLANFCFSEDRRKVAAVDFQYVGGACGMKDVAYLLGSCLSSAECELYEDDLLDYYFLELKRALENSHTNVDFIKLEEEWLKLYPAACADFTRFLFGWMPSHQKVNAYNLKMMNKVLADL
jgi:hypothetical protein